MNANTVKLAAVAAVAFLGAYALSRAWQAAGAAAGAAGEALWAVSPTNQDNVIYQTVNKPVEWVTGRPGETLGGAIYEVTHDGTLNPASTNNVIYRNITPGGQSLGSWLYDRFN